MNLIVLIATLTLHQTQNDCQTDEIIEVKLSNMKYAMNSPVTIHRNNTISLFVTEAAISCMYKACF